MLPKNVIKTQLNTTHMNLLALNISCILNSLQVSMFCNKNLFGQQWHYSISKITESFNTKKVGIIFFFEIPQQWKAVVI